MILIFAGAYVLTALIAGQTVAVPTEIIAPNNNHGRIVGGSTAYEGQWPWQVAISKSRSNSRFLFVCGGILIGSNWVLSAAHCFTESDITGLLLQFGVYDLTNPSEESQIRFTDSPINHPDYSPVTFHADISLLEFSESLTFTHFIQPVGLPSTSTIAVAGQSCIASGFGQTRGTGAALSVLRYAELQVIPLSTCNEWYSDIGWVVTDDHICAGYEDGGIDTCQGDSGGPLVCPASSETNLYVVQGITSFGNGCALPRNPGAYTNVAKYIDWIVRETKLQTGTGIPFIPNAAVTKHLRGSFLLLLPISCFSTHFYGAIV